MTKPVRGFSWVTPAVYPLYAAVGVGVLAAVTIMSRKLTADPAVTAFRSKRGKELDPDVEAASKYHDNSLRRFVHGRRIGILPDWQSPSGKQEEVPKTAAAAGGH